MEQSLQQVHTFLILPSELGTDINLSDIRDWSDIENKPARIYQEETSVHDAEFETYSATTNEKEE